MQPTVARVREIYQRQAARYDRCLRLPSRLLGFDEGRAWACAGLEGTVLEIGIGTCLNLGWYPAAARVTGVDLSSEMLAVGRRRAAALGRDVDLRIADAGALPFVDASFDAVTATLLLCTAPDPVAAVREAWRVARREIRFFDHGIASSRLARGVERVLEPLTLRFDADRLTLDPRRVFADAGVPIDSVVRSKLGVCWHVRAVKGA